jgi:hypothetical protein
MLARCVCLFIHINSPVSTQRRPADGAAGTNMSISRLRQNSAQQPDTSTIIDLGGTGEPPFVVQAMVYVVLAVTVTGTLTPVSWVDEIPGPVGPRGVAGTDETLQRRVAGVALQEILELPPPLMQVGDALMDVVTGITVTVADVVGPTMPSAFVQYIE